MKSPFLSFVKKILVYSVILGAITAAIAFIFRGKFLTPALPFLFFFFISATLLSCRILLQSLQKRFIRFINTYLLVTIVKLVVYISVMVVYVLLNRADAVPFMLDFFILYLCYTLFEVVFIIGKTRIQPPGS